jgi:hypothetical protein
MRNIFISVGFGNVVAASRVIAIVNPGSSPIKKLKDEAKARGKVIDATEGRRTRSLIVTDSDHVILSAIQVETIALRMSEEQGSRKGAGHDQDSR